MATLFTAYALSGINKLLSGLIPVDPFWDEAAYENDRAILQRLAADAATAAEPIQTVAKKTLDKTQESLLKLKEETEVLASLPLPTPVPVEDSTDRQCTVCQETKDPQNLARASCGHDYCQDCLQDLFKSSLTNESLFPPRCCRQLVRLEDYEKYLSAEIIASYNQKKKEFETTDRTYCWLPRCSTFISAENIDQTVASCPACQSETCTKCKSQSHAGDCKTDSDMQPTLEAATENGWKRCYSCRRMVELESGCNHMTCLCGAQFCYVCGDKWKTCACPQFSEGSIINVEDEAIPAAMPGGARALQVQIAEAAARIRTSHSCTHDRWARVSGEHFCEQCYQMSTSHIFECETCHTQACGDCNNHAH